MRTMDYKEWASHIGMMNANEATVLSKSWVVGGFTGGTCWGEKPNSPIQPESEPRFSQLDAILTGTYTTIFTTHPGVSESEYSRILRDLAWVENEIWNEYYGNWIEYRVHKISLPELYEWLRDRGKMLLIDPETDEWDFPQETEAGSLPG